MPKSWDCACDKMDLWQKDSIAKGTLSVCVSHSAVPNSATPWTVARQAPLSMGFSRQEYWRRLPFPSPGDPPNSRIKPRSPALQADSLSSEPPGKQKEEGNKCFPFAQFSWKLKEPRCCSRWSSKAEKHVCFCVCVCVCVCACAAENTHHPLAAGAFQCPSGSYTFLRLFRM